MDHTVDQKTNLNKSETTNNHRNHILRPQKNPTRTRKLLAKCPNIWKLNNILPIIHRSKKKPIGPKPNNTNYF